MIALCCVAHIGFSAPGLAESHRGFYRQLHQLLRNLMEVNAAIAETLVRDRLLGRLT